MPVWLRALNYNGTRRANVHRYDMAAATDTIQNILGSMSLWHDVFERDYSAAEILKFGEAMSIVCECELGRSVLVEDQIFCVSSANVDVDGR